MYPKGTLVKIKSLYINFKPADVSDQDIYGYITEASEYTEEMIRKEHLYRVYAFKDGTVHRLWHGYISPVTEIE